MELLHLAFHCVFDRLYPRYYYMDPVHVISEVDGVRIISIDKCEFLHKVPGGLQESRFVYLRSDCGVVRQLRMCFRLSVLNSQHLRRPSSSLAQSILVRSCMKPTRNSSPRTRTHTRVYPTFGRILLKPLIRASMPPDESGKLSGRRSCSR